MVYCGSSQYPFPDIFAHFDQESFNSARTPRFSLYGITFLQHHSKFGLAKRISKLEDLGKFESPVSVASILAATDPKDKVFGLRSILPTILGSILVNHKSSVADLYTKVTTRTIKFEGHLKSLAFVAPSIFNPDFHLPSWVPDLSSSPPILQTLNFHGWKSSRQPEANFASDNFSCSTQPEQKFAFTKEGKVLRDIGRKVGNLADCANSIPNALTKRLDSIRNAYDFVCLTYSPKTLEFMKSLRGPVPSTVNDISPSKRLIECLFEWEKPMPADTGLARLVKNIDVPFKVILAGLFDSSFSIEELDVIVREELGASASFGRAGAVGML
jgi:hypothetical protein